jgi:ABC-type nitrate/sulfonate/bicarbonate transport system permease component
MRASARRIWGWRAAIVIATLVAAEWWATGRSQVLYVAPTRVLGALWRLLRLETYPSLPADLALTAGEVVAAYGLAVALGIGLGFALGLPRHLGDIYGPILGALYAVPSVVWYPSLMLLFGLGPASKIAFGLLLGFFPIALGALTGIRSVDRHLLAVARAYGAGSLACFFKVILPAMAATLVAGLRAGLALTVVGVVVGEVLGSRGGLGALINHAYGFLRTADYAALALLILALVVAIDGLAALAEGRARRWTT